AARVDGVDHATGPQGFFRTAHKPVVALATREGYRLRLTADHRVRRVRDLVVEWCEAGQLAAGDRVLLNDHRRNAEWNGALSFDEGYALGLLVGDEPLTHESRSVFALAANGDVAASRPYARRDGARDVAMRMGMSVDNVAITPVLERASSDGYRGFLRGFFDAECTARGSVLRVSRPERTDLEAVQRMLLRLGVASSIEEKAGRHALSVTGENIRRYADVIGFGDAGKAAFLAQLVERDRSNSNRERWLATVMSVTPDGAEDVYDVQVPGINTFDANGLHAHNCGEQPLPPYGSCLLGSINLTLFVRDPFGPKARFDFDEFREVVRVFTRMLDNVVEINGLPLEQQRDEILSKRRHGMGFLGLGSTLAMLKLRYGAKDACAFTEDVSREMALAGWEVGLSLAQEKGPAPILARTFTVTGDMLRKRPEMAADGWKAGDEIPGRVLHAKYSRYMQRVAGVAPELVAQLAEHGARFTHHSSIAPTGTISLSLANNASNGIEPSFAHLYSRNVIREGKKSKEKVEVFSFELLAYRELINARAMPLSDKPDEKLPDYFVAADEITPTEHVDIQAAAQRWIDSSISKTANVPTDYPYEDFKNIYTYAHSQGLKGCTTFRFNPAAFQGVLVKETDLENTIYRFELEDGSVVEVKGNEEIEYDGETHTAANLFDALKEGYYGKF
ncbi:MAG TPA: LAGLIDADG family homing endonuclease, partial [Tahibacter sp.]|nr:LAGLIDADG family homing endonuclease [Tahibacter sp.]